MRPAILPAAALVAALSVPAAGVAQPGPSRETVARAADEPITNVPGKRLVSVVVTYPPGGVSLPHRHAGSAFLYAYVLEGADGVKLDGFIQIGVAREDQPHYLRLMGRPDIDLGDLIGFGLGAIAAQTGRNGMGRPNHGVLAPVRTYESPADRRLEEAGFAEIAIVTLLLKETLVRVAEPGLVPAAVRPWEVTRGS